MDKKTTKQMIYLAGGAACLAAGAVCYLSWSNQSIETTNYTIRSSRLPEAFHGFRITQVSDLQSEYFGPNQAHLLTDVRRSRPDIIVITGDLVDRRHTDFMASMKAISGLLKIAPVYYVNGNHELLLPERKILPFYEELKTMGVHVLFDKSEVIERDGEHITIMGLSEQSLYGAKRVGWELGKSFRTALLCDNLRTMREDVDDGFSIMLVHEPQFLEEYITADPDLIFAGHAHGGQFRLPNGQGLFSPGQGPLPKITSGIHKCGDARMIVSRGLGNSLFPIRLNNRPELVTAILAKE